MSAVSPPHRKAGARGGVRVPPIHLPLPGGLLQMAGLPGGRHATSHARPQIHYHLTGGGHCLSGHGHQPAGGCGLGHDAVVLWPPLHAGFRKAGKVRRTPAVLRHCAAHRHEKAGGELCLPPRVERQPQAAHMGGHSTVHSRWCGGGHHEQ